MTLNKMLLIVGVVCLVVAFIITVGWVDAAGNARDGWMLGGLTLGFASFLP